MLENRLTAYRDESLGQVSRDRGQARALSASDNDEMVDRRHWGKDAGTSSSIARSTASSEPSLGRQPSRASFSME